MDDIVERIDAREMPISRYFFEIGYAASWADAFMARGQVAPFDLTDHVIDRAWQIAPECNDDPTEFDKYIAAETALSDEIRTLRTRLAEWQKVAEEMAGALEAMCHEETVSVHIGYDHGCGGGAYVYADAIRTDSDAFRSGERALTTYRNMKGQSDG